MQQAMNLDYKTLAAGCIAREAVLSPIMSTGSNQHSNDLLGSLSGSLTALSIQTPVSRLKTLPVEILNKIIAHLGTDEATLDALSGAKVIPADVLQDARQTLQQLTVRGATALAECDRLLARVTNTRNGSTVSEVLRAPVRQLDLMFSYDHVMNWVVPPSFYTLIGGHMLPVLRTVRLHVTNIPFVLSRSVLQEYTTLLNAIQTRSSGSNTGLPRQISISVSLDPCTYHDLNTLMGPLANHHLDEFQAEGRICPFIGYVFHELQFAHNTLTNLTILEDEQRGWGAPHIPPADFSVFRHLRRLRAPASAWFDFAACGRDPEKGFLWGIERVPRPSINALLPAGLRHLRVDFIRYASIFAAGSGHRSQLGRLLGGWGGAPTNVDMEPAYRWMTALVDKATGLRNLESFEAVRPLLLCEVGHELPDARASRE
jgi:hypothetical protein